jgi:hypothetical protein
VLWCSAGAAADHARAQLRYHVGSGLLDCPDQADFQRRVAEHLGYDPFGSEEGTRVSLELTAQGGALHGILEVRAAEQAEPAIRELTDSEAACDALVSALANTLALSLDPLAASMPHVPEQPATPALVEPALPVAAITAEIAAPSVPEPVESPSPAPAARPVNDASVETHGFAALGAGLSMGLVPGVAVFGSGSFGVRVRAFALELEGRADTSLRGESSDAHHRVEATAITGGLVPCMHGSFYAGCLTVRMGALQGHASSVSEPRLGSSFLTTVGVALRAELPQRHGFRARIGLEAALPLVRTELLVNGQVAWTAPPVYGGLSLALHLPLW